MSRFSLMFCAAVLVSCATPSAHVGAAEACGQATIDQAPPPASFYTIQPRETVQPFYQWESNNGYCGETSLIQSGLNNGQYMSQYNARRLCASGLDQAGDRCTKEEKGPPNYNAQLLLEPPGSATGTSRFSTAPRCLANARLQSRLYPFEKQPAGVAGLRHFLEWVKREMIKGNQVTIGVLYRGDDDPQYDHIVSVTKIGTNHDPLRAHGYFDDDVLYFDDHGLSTNTTGNPAVPPGSENKPGYARSIDGCTPYIYAYRFDQIGRTRAKANARDAPLYSVLRTPENPEVRVGTITGGDGYGSTTLIQPHNYAFSVSGVVDESVVPEYLKARPVALTISRPTYAPVTRLFNPKSPRANYNYENPMIGHSNTGSACTNTPPDGSMRVVLRATVSGLIHGRRYNCYRYENGVVPLSARSSDVVLPVPTSQFNRLRKLALESHQFRATAPTYAFSFATTSDKVSTVRCVDALAP